MAEFNIYEGMMPKIQALISPSDAVPSKEKGGTDLHPFFKKRGKRHNRDYCDACGEKGNVLCCEICPASFHLLCHDPPLTESDIPLGQFSCRACKQTGKTKDKTMDKENDMEESEQFPDFRIVISSKSDKTPNGLHHAANKVTSANESDSETNRDTGIRRETSDKMVMSKNETTSESSLCAKSPNSLNERIRTQFKNIKKGEKGTNVEGDDNTAIEDMWQIIGVNKKTKITDCNENEQNSLKENVAGSRKRRMKETDKGSPEKKFQNRDFNIKLPYCDYLLKQMSIPQEGKDSCLKINVPSEVKPLIKVNTSTEKDDNTDSFGLKKTFKHIINEVKKTNPKQFTLPTEYTEDIDLSLIASEKDPESFPNDLDYNDLLKLPTRKCYYCRGTCLTGQMISCDFCPAHFHLNCLTPPLCSIPEDKWMCPLHPHHILDKVMKNPSSLTELMTWWDELNAAVHAEEVESKFMKRIKALKKKRARKIKENVLTRIPDIVKYHYKHPMPQIPPLQEIKNNTSDCVFEGDFILVPHNLVEKSQRCCDEIKSSDEGRDTKGRNRREDNNNSIYKENTLIEISDDYGTTDVKKDLKNRESKVRREDLSTWDEKNKEFKFKSCGIYNYDELNVHEKSTLYKRNKSAKISQTLNLFQSQNYSRTQFGQSSNIENYGSFEKINSSTQRGAVLPSWKTIESIILRDMDYNFISDSTDGFVFAKFENNLKELLANEVINRVVRDLPPSFKPDALPYPFFPPSLNNNVDLPVKPMARVRAVLCPLSHRAPLVYMHNHTLSIGCATVENDWKVDDITSYFESVMMRELKILSLSSRFVLHNFNFSNDVCLLNYGNCNFVSGEHAIIYYDSFTNAYELLNYSEYSTVVDGVIYTCDILSNTVDEESDSYAINNVKTEEKDSVDEAKIDVIYPVKEEPLEDSSENSSSVTIKGKKSSSVAGAAETRSIYKKLLHDIDRLVSKSQEEMASIAEEDLAEIAKAIKAPINSCARLEESPTEKQKSKRKDSTTPIKRSKEKKNTKENETDSVKNNRSTSSSKVNEDSSFDTVSDCKIIETANESDKMKQRPQTKTKEPTNVSEDSMDTVVVRRSQRRIKRSIFSTYRREMRGKKSRNKILEDMDDESSEKESEKEETKKTASAENDEDESSEDEHQLSVNDHLSSDDFSIHEGREKCLCQVNNVKFPNGRDETWEKAAPLYHGSHIRFGCVEFVFSIVGYPAPLEDRPYRGEKQSTAAIRKSSASELKRTNENNEDLSSKLNSILNVLSSRSDSVSVQSSGSSGASSSSSRSNSPFPSVTKEGPCVASENGSGQLVEICYDDDDVKIELEDDCIEIKAE